MNRYTLAAILFIGAAVCQLTGNGSFWAWLIAGVVAVVIV